MTSVRGQAQIPRPSDVFGFEVGADYKVAKYDQILTYLNKLDAASDRVKLVNIGKTSLGRPMILLIISSKKNIQKLNQWRSISEKMARARIDSTMARRLSKEGKTIVWIDGGMHASEMGTGQMTSLLAYRVATEETPEMQYIRKNVILLLMPVINPDGLDMVVTWYRNHLGTPYETSVPWLWQKYVDHDNNRDYFMANMRETKNILKVQYQTWYPQIVLNQHQSGSGWAWEFIPPFQDPVNQGINPGVTAGVNAIGSAMAQRFAMKDMPGYISRTGFTMYWDGGGRTVPYYHNMLGLLTEATHNDPTPRYFDPDKRPKYLGGWPNDSTAIFNPNPWLGGTKHFGTAIKYMMTSSMATLRYAADRRADLLWGIYRMGRQAIQKGKTQAPYAFVIPKQQWDKWETKNLINILFRGGLEIKQATNDFIADGHRYDAGSYILFASQSFRPYLINLLLAQHYPVHPQYPGGPPMSSYDVVGWTLPMQMGVHVQPVRKLFHASVKDITSLISVESSTIAGEPGYGFIIDDRSNASMKAINTLMENGADVSRTTEPHSISGIDFAAGSYIVTGADPLSVKLYGLSIARLSHKPSFNSIPIQRPKVILYKTWDGNPDEGWTDWVLQQYSIDVDTLHNKAMKNKDFSQYQSIILPYNSPSFILHGYSTDRRPKKYSGGIGKKGADKIEQFVKSGGTLICFVKSSLYAIKQFHLPIEIAASDLLNNKKFYLPGSLIRTIVDTNDPLGYGMQDTVAAMYKSGYAFKIDTQKQNEPGSNTVQSFQVDVVARYADQNLVMSGGGIGVKKYLGGKPAMLRIQVGKGQVVLFGFRPQWRGQPRGTYKLIFNAITNATMDK